ncbi:MAG: flagellar basal body P-ring formation protein FlgA [Deltaproteobacteria bacterium]|nr:flagellar basal body P-ring formation protein FlgA [Deltaproteobacteria bacterium]
MDGIDLFPGPSRRLGLLFFSLLLVFASWAEAGPGNFAEIKARLENEILTEVAKDHPGIEHLQIADAAELAAWLTENQEADFFTLSQVGCWNRRNGLLPVQLEAGAGNGSRRGWLKIGINGKARVLLAGRNLVRGEPVQNSDFESRLVDCRDIKMEAVNNLPADMFYQLAVGLRAGEPLLARQLRPFILIKRGELVQVVLEDGGVRIRTKGVAMKNGALQDVIPVKNPVSLKLYQARIVGSGEVTVVY